MARGNRWYVAAGARELCAHRAHDERQRDELGILVSTDGTSFTKVASGTWPADAKPHTAVFGPVAARYVRFEARAANGSSATLTDITIGANR